MPELPEIETIKLQLQKYLVGQVISRIEQYHPKSVQGNLKLVGGKKITNIRRFGKLLVFDLSHSMHIMVHFKMSGQLILVRSRQSAVGSKRNPSTRFDARRASLKKEKIKTRIAGGHPTADWTSPLPGKHTRAVFHFKDKDVMYFNDQRIFGWVKIVSSQQLAEDRFIKRLGPEPWNISDKQFFKILNSRKKPIKVLTMDQDVLSGVGNIYANDALWEARIHPSRKAQSLTSKEASFLRHGLEKVLKEGIKYGGATMADAKYVNLEGLGGTYQNHFRVYSREGQYCLRKNCGVIKKTVIGGRGTFFCEVCQK